MKLGQKMSLKLLSINQESQNMTEMLLKSFKKYSSFVSSLKYSLSEKEVMEIARISKEACGFF